MIFVLTMLYLLVFYLVYFRFKVLPFDLTNKIGSVLVGLIMILGLLVATNYAHPHSSDVRLFAQVIPLTTLTSRPGRVVEVAVQPNVSLKKGDVLFKLDPRPYEYEVHRLEASLSAAEQDVPQLESAVKAAQAAVESQQAVAEDARIEYDRSKRLLDSKATSESEYNTRVRNKEAAEAKERQAIATLEKAQLAYDSKINGENTSVAQVRQQLADAKYDLEQTVAVAPADGFVVNLQVRPGSYVTPSSSVMSFVVSDESNVLVATFAQNPLANIEAGMPVEVAFVMYPGRIFKGEVETVIQASGYGQLEASGDLPEFAQPLPKGRFAVRIKLKDENVSLPMGASASAIVYTKTLKPLGMIQKVTIRMESYLNFITSPM